MSLYCFGELAEWQGDPTEVHQEVKRAELPGDVNPIQLTLYEAAKCQAVLTSFVNGQVLLDFAVRNLVMPLSVRSLTAAGVPTRRWTPGPASINSRGHRPPRYATTIVENRVDRTTKAAQTGWE